MNIVYFGSLQDPSGYGEAARSNVLALNNLRVEVKAECIRHHQGDDVFLLPIVAERLATLMEKPTLKPYIKIHHQTPEYYGHPPRDEAAKFINRKLLQELGNGTYNIGYTVIEVNRIHPYWVDQMNLMDEIWTSSKFCRDIFIECGVQTPVKVMPHGVDTDFYRPLAEPLLIKNKASFNFLSIFQWTPRKAPEILLAAYLQEFSAEDDVSLTLRVYGSSTSQAERQRVIKMLKRVESDDLDIRHRRPKILMLHDFIPTSKIPSLYTAADCFVLPSRGEGFGLPYLEAMSCGVPVIGTAWSAMTEFMNPFNSYLIRPDRLGPCRGMEHIPWYQHWMQWAEPCVNELRYMMRQVFENRDEARRKAEIARKDVIEKYDWSVTGRLMKERLISIWKRRDKWAAKQSV